MSGNYIVKCAMCGRKRRFVDADDVEDVCEDCRYALQNPPIGGKEDE